MNTKIANTSRISRNAADQHLADGLTKRKHDITSFMIGGTSHTPDDILIVLQARLAAANLVQSTRATWQSAVKADRDERAKTKTFVSGLRQTLKVAFDGSIDALSDFGLSPRKLHVPTPEQKAKAIAKAKATRVARHTMGPKKKLAIRGTAPQAAPGSPATANVPPAHTGEAAPMPTTPHA
jgi:hypothetical protein